MQPGNNQNGPYARSNAERRMDASDTLWSAAGTLYSWRRFIIVTSFAVAVAAAVITLLVPNWYRATATVLVPESGVGGFSALFQNLPSAASSLLGGSSGDYVRYIAILNSRSVLAPAVDSFNLVAAYELEDEEHPQEEALKVLRDNLAIELDEEYNYLLVSVSDEDRERAARIANFLVNGLNQRNSALSSQNAASYRQYIESRYLEARATMDSVLNATAAFQKRYGIYDLPTQTESFFEQVAELRANALEAEIQSEALREQYGSDNPRVTAFREIAEAANRKYQAALAGQEQLLPVPKSEVPEVGRQYVNLEMERTIQRTILEVVGPMYEQARLQEEKESQAVQVLDEAVPPVKKAGPKRTLIVLFSGASAFILACLLALGATWWRRHATEVAHRLHSESTRSHEAVESGVA